MHFARRVSCPYIWFKCSKLRVNSVIGLLNIEAIARQIRGGFTPVRAREVVKLAEILPSLDYPSITMFKIYERRAISIKIIS